MKMTGNISLLLVGAVAAALRDVIKAYAKF